MEAVGPTGQALWEVALLRLAAQGIAGPGQPAAADVVRRLTAVQAQDYPGAVLSLALRVAGGTRAGVEAALTGGAVVRSWPMRGTLHFVLVEDLPWMLALTAERSVRAAARRRAELGLDDAALSRAVELAVAALSGGRRARRNELLAGWDAHGLDVTGQRGYHLIWQLAQRGTLCFGPVEAGEQLIVLSDEWIRAPRRPEREEALGEWALRYFRGHGPATVRDFAWWTKLLAADVRAGVALAMPQLERLSVDGTEYLMDPATPEALAACRRHAAGVLLLPGFDEFMLGYADRGAALPAEFAQRIVPGGNGMFMPTVVAGGQVVGTWRRRPARGAFPAEPFTTFTPAVTRAVERRFAALP